MSSIHEVAKYAGVSASTVSRVLNGTKYVSPEVREQVLQAVEALNYQPSIPARSLRLQQTQIIGVLLPSLKDYFFGSLAFVIEQTLLTNNYRPLFCNTENSHDKEADYMDMLMAQRVDGILMVPTTPSPAVIERIQATIARKIPVVLMDNGIPSLEVSQVLPANRQGGYRSAAHLLALGHRHISLITPGKDKQPPTTGGGYERLLGMYEAFEDYQVPFDPDLIIIEDLEYIEMGYQGTHQLLEKHPHTTAIIAITDQVAIGVLRALYDLQVPVPQAISVMGYGDIPLAAHLIPRLTTVAQSIEEMGTLAAQKLLFQLQHRESAPELVHLETKLILRESTAPPRS